MHFSDWDYAGASVFSVFSADGAGYALRDGTAKSVPITSRTTFVRTAPVQRRIDALAAGPAVGESRQELSVTAAEPFDIASAGVNSQ
jgi:hypothetical protein